MSTEEKRQSGSPRGHPERFATEVVETAKKHKKKTNSKSKSHEDEVRKFLKDFFGLGKPKKKTKKTSPGLPGLYWRGVDEAPFSYSPGGDSGGDGGDGGGGDGGSAASVAETEENDMKLRKEMDLAARKADSLDEMGFDPGKAQNEFRQETDSVQEATQIEETPPTVVDPAEVEPIEMEEATEPPQRAEMAAGEEKTPDGPEAMEDPQMQVHKADDAVEVDPSMVEDLDVGMDYAGRHKDEDEDEDEPDEVEFEEEGAEEPMGEEEIPEVSEDEVEYDMESEPEMAEDEDEESKEEAEEEGELEEACGPGGRGPGSGGPGGRGPSGGHGDRGKMYSADEPLEVSEDDIEVVDEDRGHAAEAPTEPRTTEEPEPAEAPTLERSEEHIPAIDPTEEKGTDVVYEVIVPASTLGDDALEHIELARYGENSNDPAYIVLYDGTPVAKIALSDQNLPSEHRDTFLDDGYPNFVLEGMESFGVQETLKTVNARFFAARATEGEVAETVKARIAGEMEEERKRQISRLKDDLLNVASVVVAGSLKNYLMDNPLRDALVATFIQAGVDPSAAVDEIDEVFRTAGPDFFNTVLETADEFLGLPKEALDHHVQKIQEMSHRHPGYDMIPVQREDAIPEAVEAAPQVQVASVPRSVPLRSAAPSQNAQTGNFKADKDYWKRQLNLGGRVVNASLAQYQLRKPNK